MSAYQVQRLTEKFEDYMNEYALKKYKDEEHSFINTEDEEDKFESFCEELFNSSRYDDFDNYVRDEEEYVCSADKILLLLNWVNKILKEEYDDDIGLTGDITTTKIINNVGYLMMRQTNDELLEFLKFNTTDDDESDCECEIIEEEKTDER